MYCTKLEQAHVLQNKGRFAKRPSLVLRVDSMTVEDLKEAFKQTNAYMAQKLGVRLGHNGEPLDWEQFRWALREMLNAG